MLRECDNENCDYVTYTVDGASRARWEHVTECEGPVDFGSLVDNEPPDGSFLAYLQARS